MKRPVALISGITGQDGSYLTEFLLEKGYEVHGLIRRISSSLERQRIESLKDKITLHYGNLSDATSIRNILNKVKPDEIYNLASQSDVGISFEVPEEALDITYRGVLRMLKATKEIVPNAKFYQASSSEMFGKVLNTPQNENTPFNEQSPYGEAKVLAHLRAQEFRKNYGMYVCCGILFNHESERRGENFVTRKITRALARIKLGIQDKLSLGNIDAKRDWGYAKDYVEVMWLMMQQENPEDFVIGSGEEHKVRDFIELSAKYLGLNIQSNGKKGIEEKYVDENNKVIIDINPKYFRPTEVNKLLADSSKAKEKMGWSPKVKFPELVKIMTEHDLKLAEKEAIEK